MKDTAIEIRKIRKDELSFVRDFPPPGWNTDLEKVWSRHYDQDYFYPIVAILNSEIVGTGMAIINNNSTWLGHIIVRDDQRHKGIGTAITNHLIDYSRTKGVYTVILTASELGLPIYKKIGFVHDTNYLFLKSDNQIKIDSVSRNISPVIKTDYNSIFELDYSITGEKREKVLTSALETGFRYRDKKIEGYYLPDFGKDLIIADTEIAGIELLKFRFSLDNSPVCVPETNQAAIDFFTSLGFYQYLKVPRLFLNQNVDWNPNKVYSRGCGYMG